MFFYGNGDYQGKHKKVIGIEVADIFNNLIWRAKKGISTPAGEKLFQKLNVKEIKWEQQF